MQSFLRTFTAAAILLAAGSSALNATCSTGIHIMAAGGCSLPCPADYGGILLSLVSDITVQYPGSDLYYVPYNSSTTQGRVSSIVMQQAVQQYAVQCPSTPIVLLGWSLGGIVVMNTMCSTVPPKQMKSVIAAIAYGEETYVGGLPYDAGSCTTKAPNYPRANTTACLPYASKIQNYCDAVDSYCCVGGTNPGSHSVYATEYDTAALNFIISKYNSRP